jgi:hypothetical protein
MFKQVMEELSSAIKRAEQRQGQGGRRPMGWSEGLLFGAGSTSEGAIKLAQSSVPKVMGQQAEQIGALVAVRARVIEHTSPLLAGVLCSVIKDVYSGSSSSSG